MRTLPILLNSCQLGQLQHSPIFCLRVKPLQPAVLFPLSFLSFLP